MSEANDPLGPQDLGKLNDMMRSYVAQQTERRSILRPKSEPKPLRWCPVCGRGHTPEGLISRENGVVKMICDACNRMFDQGMVAVCCENPRQYAFVYPGRYVSGNPDPIYEGRPVVLVSGETMDKLMAEAERQKQAAQGN